MGLHHAWIVTPGSTDGDGGGGGNHHIAQHRAATTSLLAAIHRISHDRIFCFNISECQIVADPHRALLAGHGHAGWLALLLGAAMPDRTLGVIAMAPYPRPAATGFLAAALDPSMRAVLDRQQGWRRGELAGHNLHGVPVHISVYENDTTVYVIPSPPPLPPVWWAGGVTITCFLGALARTVRRTHTHSTHTAHTPWGTLFSDHHFLAC